MRIRILAVLTPIVVALAILAGSVSTPAAERWEGVYRVVGTNPDGSNYTGVVEIRQVPNSEFYQAAWVIDTAPDEIAMIAIGFVYDDRLVLTGMHSPMPILVKTNGDVRWAIPNAPTLGREKFTRTKFKTLSEAVRPTAAPRRPAPQPGSRV